MRLDNMKRVKSTPPVFAVPYGRSKNKLPENLLIQTVVNAVKAQVLRTIKLEEDNKLSSGCDCSGCKGNVPANERHYTNKRAKEIGAKHLGSGNFASVFKHPALEGKVIKVVLNTADNYHEYARWCLTQNNKHIPKIYNMEDIGDGRYIFVLDELSSVYDDNYDVPRDVTIIRDVLEYGYDDELYTEKYGIEIGDETRDAMIGLLLLKECNLLRFDLHNGNMMLDKDGNVVITDPVY